MVPLAPTAQPWLSVAEGDVKERLSSPRPLRAPRRAADRGDEDRAAYPTAQPWSSSTKQTPLRWLPCGSGFCHCHAPSPVDMEARLGAGVARAPTHSAIATSVATNMQRIQDRDSTQSSAVTMAPSSRIRVASAHPCWRDGQTNPRHRPAVVYPSDNRRGGIPPASSSPARLSQSYSCTQSSLCRGSAGARGARARRHRRAGSGAGWIPGDRGATHRLRPSLVGQRADHLGGARQHLACRQLVLVERFRRTPPSGGPTSPSRRTTRSCSCYMMRDSRGQMVAMPSNLLFAAAVNAPAARLWSIPKKAAKRYWGRAFGPDGWAMPTSTRSSPSCG